MAGSEKHHAMTAPDLGGEPTRVLVVRSPYYLDIADELTKGAVAALEGAGAEAEVVDVPGALEIPSAIALAGRGNRYDGFVALGCVIRGETTHYETVCNDSSRGLTLLGLQGFCIGNGILTVENRAQAEVRAEAAGQNKGGGAAIAALHLIALSRQFADTPRGIGFKPKSEEFKMAGDPGKTTT